MGQAAWLDCEFKIALDGFRQIHRHKYRIASTSVVTVHLLAHCGSAHSGSNSCAHMIREPVDLRLLKFVGPGHSTFSLYRSSGREDIRPMAHHAGTNRGHGEKRASGSSKNTKLTRPQFEKKLRKRHIELVKFQERVNHIGAKIVILFEGRDAAGKGGVIKRITQRVGPPRFQSRRAACADRTRKVSALYSSVPRESSGRGKSSCSTGAGTIAHRSSGRWAFVPKSRPDTF